MSSLGWGMVPSMNTLFSEAPLKAPPRPASARDLRPTTGSSSCPSSKTPQNHHRPSSARPSRPSSPRKRRPTSPRTRTSSKNTAKVKQSNGENQTESRDSSSPPRFAESESLKKIVPTNKIIAVRGSHHEQSSIAPDGKRPARQSRPTTRPRLTTSQSVGWNMMDTNGDSNNKKSSLLNRRGVGGPGTIVVTGFQDSSLLQRQSHDNRKTRSVSPTPSPKNIELYQRHHSNEDASPARRENRTDAVSATARLRNIIGLRKVVVSPQGSMFGGFGRKKNDQGNQRRPRVLSDRPMKKSPKTNIRKALPGVDSSNDEVTKEEGGVRGGAEISCSHRPSAKVIQEGIDNWIISNRPEIEPSELIAEDVLDDRHGRRQVKCVVWKPKKNLEGAGTKFALKISIRGKNDAHSWRLFSEKDIMSSLDSPWHTKLVNTFKTDNCLYMLMEYESLSSVDQYIENGVGLRPGGLAAVRFYTACAVVAIEYMHKRGIIHRDIKPSNFLIDKQGYVKLCDYGLSKFLKIGERTNTFLGTVPYLSPELVNEKYYDHSVDFWSLGVSCYEMAYGSSPFEPRGMLNDQEWIDAVKSNVRTGQFRLPAERVGLPARLFMKNLLNRELDTRLGADLNYEAIKRHSFFSSIDMISLQIRTATAPPVGKPLPKASRMA